MKAMTTKRQSRQKSTVTGGSSHLGPESENSQMMGMNTLGGIPYFTHLLNIGQALCGQTSGVAECLCQEIEQVTRGQARLLHQKASADRMEEASFFSSTEFSFPVQFGGLTYGTLFVAPNQVELASPTFPRALAHALAQFCGWLLYTLELSVFIQGPCHLLNQHLHSTLTKRQREVLVLMARGYNNEEIAETLNVTLATVDKHRQHIYERLDVHCEHDALLVAYRSGLFSPFQEIVR